MNPIEPRGHRGTLFVATSSILIGVCGALIGFDSDFFGGVPLERSTERPGAETGGSGGDDPAIEKRLEGSVAHATQRNGIAAARATRTDAPADGPPTTSAVLDFGAHGTVEVTLTAEVPRSAGVPRSVPLDDVFDELLARAETGDASATRELYERMESCRALLKGGRTLEESLDRLRTERIFFGPMGSRHIEAEEIPRRAEQIRRGFARCGEIEEQIRSHGRRVALLLDTAAEQDLLAMRALLRRNRADPVARMATLERMWSLGYAEALTEISAVFRNTATATGDVQARIQDYAHYRAFTEIMAAAWNAGDRRRNATRLHHVEALLAQKAGDLSPGHQNSGDRLAIDLVRENPNCCRGIFAFR